MKDKCTNYPFELYNKKHSFLIINSITNDTFIGCQNKLLYVIMKHSLSSIEILSHGIHINAFMRILYSFHWNSKQAIQSP